MQMISNQRTYNITE